MEIEPVFSKRNLKGYLKDIKLTIISYSYINMNPK